MKVSGTLLKTWRMMMDEIKHLYVRRNEENIIWNRVGQEVIIIITREDEDKVLRLNKTAGFIWENCDGKKTIQEVIKDLCLKYEVEEATAMDEAVKLLNQMQKKQLITFSKEPS
jgi:hypothetical protein